LKRLLKKSPETPFYLVARQGAHRTVNNCTVLVKEDGRHPSHLVSCRRLRRVVDIHLCEFDLSIVVLCQFVQNRFKASAVASPGCGEIDEDRTGKRSDLIPEGRVGHIYHGIGIKTGQIESCPAFAAPGLFSPTVLRHTVLGTAIRTTNDYAFTCHGCSPFENSF
jgi:hypothetical protein